MLKSAKKLLKFAKKFLASPPLELLFTKPYQLSSFCNPLPGHDGAEFEPDCVDDVEDFSRRLRLDRPVGVLHRKQSAEVRRQRLREGDHLARVLRRQTRQHHRQGGPYLKGGR